MGYIKSRIDVISMGCSKNLTDSERLMRRLEAKGYDMHHDADDACGEYVVLNTCGFIGDAKEESIEALLRLCEMKAAGDVGRIVVMGCLSQRYMDDIKKEIPEVDLWYGKFDWTSFVDTLPPRPLSGEEVRKGSPADWERSLTTPPWSAYLKISEGCDRFCAFCAIPLITGRHKSRPVEEIITEVKTLAAGGVREFNVIAQDLSSYGTDLYGRHALASLIDEMADIPGVEWIRLHYAYPADFPYDILEVMRRRDNVCSYIDIALQHISDNVLTRMRRHIDKDSTLRLIRRLREEVPGIRIRTTLMVGFPGETDRDFEELLEFVRECRFDRLGAFAYSEEEDTYAARMYADDVPADEKQRRLEILMAEQESIDASLGEAMVGSVIKVLVEEESDGYFVGRSQWDSPEVDPEVYIRIPDCAGVLPRPGEFVQARVYASEPFILYAELI